MKYALIPFVSVILSVRIQRILLVKKGKDSERMKVELFFLLITLLIVSLLILIAFELI